MDTIEPKSIEPTIMRRGGAVVMEDGSEQLHVMIPLEQHNHMRLPLPGERAHGGPVRERVQHPPH